MTNNVLLFLSEEREGQQKSEYNYIKADGSEKRYSGVLTNDAPFRCLIDEMRSGGLSCDNVMVLCTDRVKQKDGLNRFKKRVLEEFGLADKVKEIDISDNPDEAEIIKKSVEIMNLLSEGDNLYIDISGGLRDFLFILIAVLRFAQIKGIGIKKMLYSNFSNLLLIDRTKIYGMYDFISGADEFVGFGKTQKLFEYYKGTNNQKIIEVLGILKEIEEALVLCDHQHIKKIFKKLNKAINTFDINNNKTDLLFNEFISIVEREYGSISHEPDALDIIEWCIEKDFIQSALSFWTELVPDCFIEKILKPKKSLIPKSDNSMHSAKYEFMKNLKDNKAVVNEIGNCYNTGKSSYAEIYEYVKNIKKIDREWNNLDYLLKTDSRCRQIVETVIEVCNLNREETLAGSNKKPIISNAKSNEGVIKRIIKEDTLCFIEEQTLPKALDDKCNYQTELKQDLLNVLKKYYLIKGYRNNIHHINGVSLTKDELKKQMINAIVDIKEFKKKADLCT